MVESVHRGAFAIVEHEDVVHGVGDIDATVFYRSAEKPLQALVGITSGAADRFGLGPRELAIAAGSHDATPSQLDVVRSLMDKAGIAAEALQCGGHPSIDPDRARAQQRELAPDAPYPALWSNCSGKHASMLAAARCMDASLADYLAPTHPVQRAITEHVAAFADVDSSDVAVGIDGCGTPAHAVPLRAIAHSLRRFGTGDVRDGGLADAARRVARAMAAHPELVGGERRFDTDLMRAAEARLLAKAGAEGVHVVVAPDRELALAVKVDDGNDRGYRVLVIAVLERLGLLAPAAAKELAERHGKTVRNYAGTPAGRLEVDPAVLP